jgi:S-disulfanyl-L-cysteine oxidoreductase SoxD
MFSFRDALMSFAPRVAAVVGLVLGASASLAQPSYVGIGRAATPQEIQAWDIDVRPDFKGLPQGSGSVAKGMQVWEAKCASCHGVFGENNEVFTPIVGGTTKKDIETGVVARLTDASFPGRTTMMKLSSLSTLWDYINRAMPWTQPKSLSVEEVYAVTAYILNLAEVLPADFVLSDRNVADVQKRLPNRDGMTTAHSLWPGRGIGGGKPDVIAAACMNNCAGEPKVASSLPDHARNSHGNLADQNRLVGPQRGVNTDVAVAKAPHSAAAGNLQALALIQKHSCTACHGVNNRLVGPGFKEIAARYAGKGDALAYLAGKVQNGGQGVWGSIAMPPQALSQQDVHTIAAWLAAGVTQ